MADEFIFFGTKSEYRNLAEKENIKIEVEENEQKPIRKSEVINISAEDGKPISEKMMSTLKRTRHLHDTRTVYMQSDMSFYDVFYKQTEDDIIDDPELLQEARSIRRIYKTYPEYLYALYIRELYIEKLVQKMGSEVMFTTLLRSGGITEWIPPAPIYSKKADDYEYGSNGLINSGDLIDWEDDLLCDLLEQLQIEKGVTEDGSSVEVIGDVLTDHLSICHSDSTGRCNETQQTGRMSVNLSDMNELQQIFRGWYQDDTSKSSKKTTEDRSLSAKAFRNTPERIRQDYYLSKIFDFSKQFQNVLDGISNEPEYDPNELVYDSETSKPMSRKEYDARRLVRTLKDSGWTESLKIMKLLNVGSSREQSILSRKNSAKKKRAKKKVRSYSENTIDTGIYGDRNLDKRELFTDLDKLKAQMYPD